MISYRSDEPAGMRRWRHRLGLPVVGALVLAVVDIWLLVIIGHQVGALPVLAFVIIEAGFGGWLIRRRWHAVWQRLASVNEGRLDLDQPQQQVAKAVDTGLVVAGGVALIFPGVITALLGLLLLLPVTRRLPAGLLNNAIGRRIPGLGDLGLRARVRRPSGYGDVIEGEVVEGDVVADESSKDRTDEPAEPTIIREVGGERHSG